ncbi:UDP-N-acetylglucosamine pyrophosphorylase isoform X2 [Physcomitrium patens]|uniref:UDP-N-acetylglucosamine pyrophosphorylase n=1 Tax=Physcomitrium patens TaxID=3218 RepID=A0A7I4DLB6_PHYPA|nr:UDP-N-acetylglucosamine pyrophosphorylase-like isoform X2 [Physcomitrium patens]|eukprot:XP_024373294.1 UDP-N-acetylglucosamine pyrophosphorylase-like isoform X2 [Physcomitrella patens]
MWVPNRGKRLLCGVAYEMEHKIAALRSQLADLGQEHVLAGLSSGDSSQRQSLVDQVSSIDLPLFRRALADVVRTLKGNKNRLDKQPIPPKPFPQAKWEGLHEWISSSGDTSNEKDDTARWWSEGLRLVADGEVAVLVLAGGQGTRLGPGAPVAKGMLELSVPEPKSLFQLQAERLLLVEELAAFVTDDTIKRRIPWLVMTSDATDLATRTFFEEKNFFGLEKSQVWFLKQSSLPCVDLDEGHAMLMEAPWKVAMAPAGNGALFSDLRTAGFIKKLSSQGVKYVQVYAVDNALVRVADPVFYGFIHRRQAEVGVKVVSKIHAKESVGVVCLHQEGASNLKCERYGVLEYSEMPESLTTAKDNSGQLQFRAAHICINMFSVHYLEKLTDLDSQLEFHPAVKRIPHMRKTSGIWETVNPARPNGIKLEQFIFDSFQSCDSEKVALLEVSREEEFAPIKNAVGPGIADTVATATELLLALKQRVSALTPEIGAVSKGFALLKAYAGGATESATSDLVNLSIE